MDLIIICVRTQLLKALLPRVRTGVPHKPCSRFHNRSLSIRTVNYDKKKGLKKESYDNIRERVE
eukprot:COSAG06_NODE_1099_length_10711_cov_145.571711_8_plen_64_part_00